ncbi:MAG: hypothetical protein HIU82_11330 [Proteobacteria bacterium]|nr:hypothetical protein [Pseudomonadota bacterium]
MVKVHLNQVAPLIRTWRAFERTHPQTAQELLGRIQGACEALTARTEYSRILADDTVRDLRNAISPYAAELGFNVETEMEFLFWGTAMCLHLTAQ